MFASVFILSTQHVSMVFMPGGRLAISHMPIASRPSSSFHITSNQNLLSILANASQTVGFRFFSLLVSMAASPKDLLFANASRSWLSSMFTLGTININVMMTPRSGVSVDDDEVDGVGDEIGDVDDNEVDGVGDKVGGVNTSVQCVDLMLEVIPGPQWTTAFGSIYIRTANLLWAPSDVR
ncbi:hypothetical protein NDA10_002916 [Ustilago hordei]|nr:hypothetical protein NDA10_002916 [Ustilago hordei]